jgi:hypothetical protein
MSIHAIHAFQESPSRPGEPTRIILADRRVLQQQQQQQGKTTIDDSFHGYSRLRVRIEIHPVSQSKYFHIIVQLYFEGNGKENKETNGTTDTVDLLFLAESRGSPHSDNQSPQRNHSNDGTTQPSSNLSPSGLVELSIGGELLVINVLSEQKSSGQKCGMGKNQSSGVCHCVTVRVSKGGKDVIPKKVRSLSEAVTPKEKQRKGGWLLGRLPPVRRVVTEDFYESQTSETRRSADPMRIDEEADDWMDRMIWFPIRSTPTVPDLPVAASPTTTVCLQSWSVKSISSRDVLMPPGSQNVLNGQEGTIVAQGVDDRQITRGMEFAWP